MDPITLIVSAIAAGAAAGLQDTVAEGVKNAYGALKRLIVDRYRDVDITPVEKRPESDAKRRSLEEDLVDAGASADVALLEAARRVIDEVREKAAAVGPAIGVDLERVQAEFLRISRVDSSGTGVRVREGTFKGGIDIGEVRAGQEREGGRP